METDMSWEDKFDKLFANEEFGPLIHTHKFSESTTYPKIKTFISTERQKAVQEFAERVLRDFNPSNMSISDRFYYDNHPEKNPFQDHIFKALSELLKEKSA